MSNDSIWDRYIEGTGTDADLSFEVLNLGADNPIKWGKIASSTGGSVAAGAASAAIGIPQGIATAGETLFGGAANTVDRLVGAVFEPLVTVPLGLSEGGGGLGDLYGVLDPTLATRAAAQIWGAAYIDDLGLFAGPVAVAFVLVAVYIVVLGAQQAIDTFQGGGGIL